MSELDICPHDAWSLRDGLCADCGEYFENGPQPTASVDAEQVWREALSAAAMSPRSRGASFDPDQTATAVIQAYGDARADAARREALAPFAECAEQIVSIEDDEEWAKFRLLIKDYRHARTTLAKIKDATDAD